MANEEQLAILMQWVRAWNRWRTENGEAGNYPEIDLRDADLTGAMLSGVNFNFARLYRAKLCHANLRYANLNRAHLIDADVTSADLRGADLQHAKLHNANFNFAYLHSANFTWAKLYGANLSYAKLTCSSFDTAILIDSCLVGADLSFAVLSRAKLSGAAFEKAVIENATFGDCDLSEVKGLELVEHRGPSTIGLDTIYKSKGKIPENFLRGCGVPESFITQVNSLVSAEDGIQFYSCFISYSSKDEEFARRLHGRMRDAHLRVWFAREDIQGGKKVHEQI